MILNLEKCHYMSLGKDSVSDSLRFGGEVLEGGELETVLGIQIDNKLNFENRIKSLCSKASQKIGALQRLTYLLNAQKKKKKSVQFYNKIWMFCSRRSNSLVNNVHEKIFRIVSDDHNSSYSELFNDKERTYYSSAKHQSSHETILKV